MDRIVVVVDCDGEAAVTDDDCDVLFSAEKHAADAGINAG